MCPARLYPRSPQRLVDWCLSEANQVAGLPQDIFPRYETYFDYTLMEFCSRHSPCRHKSKSCVNFKESHAKGHQSKSGKIIAVGEYTSGFTYEDYFDMWMAGIENKIKLLQEALESE